MVTTPAPESRSLLATTPALPSPLRAAEEAGKSVLWALNEAKWGILDLWRAQRIPQQASIMALLDFVGKHRRLPSPTEFFQAVKEAVKSDKSFMDVAKEWGFQGREGMILGLLGDIVLDPLWIFSPAKVARLAGLPKLMEAVGKIPAVAKAVESPVGRAAQKFAREFIHPDIGVPKEHLRNVDLYGHQVYMGEKEARAHAKELFKHLKTPEENRYFLAYIEAKTPQQKYRVFRLMQQKGMDAEKIRTLAMEWMDKDWDLGIGLVERGMMSEGQLRAWVGHHIYRAYKKHFNPQALIQDLYRQGRNLEAQKLEAALRYQEGFRGPFRVFSERLGFLHARKDIPADIRKKLGEIRNAPFLAYQQIKQTRRAQAVHDFFEATLRSGLASAVERPGWKLLPDVESLGPIRGHWVPEAIFEDIMQVADPRKGGFWTRFVVPVWKAMKIAWNPAAHVRIVGHNWFLADVFGFGPTFKPHVYAMAIHALANPESRYYKEAEQYLFLHHTVAERELDFLIARQITPETYATPHGLLGTVYRASRDVIYKLKSAPAVALEWEDRVFKMAAFIDKRLAGKSPEEAARFAETALLNYRKLPQFWERMRRWGVVPFVAFPVQATERVARAALEHPASLSKWGKIFRYVEAGGEVPYILPYRPQDPRVIQAEKSVLPEYMDQGHGWIRLPGSVRLPDGSYRHRYVNIGYIIPIQIPYDTYKFVMGEYERLTGRGVPTARRTPELTGIFNISWYPLMVATVEGKDFFTGKPFRSLDEYLDFLYRFATPPFAPSIPPLGIKGGTAWSALRAAMKQQPVNPYSHQPPARPQDVLARTVFAYSYRDIDPRMEKVRRLMEIQGEIRAVQTEIKQIATSPVYNPGGEITPLGKRLLDEQLGRLKVILGKLSNLANIDLPEEQFTSVMERSAPSGSETPTGSSVSAPTGGASLSPTTPYLQSVAIQYARTYGIPLPIALRLFEQESGWGVTRVSPAGAIGVGQLMPETARALGVNPWNPLENIEGSLRYLRQKYDEFGRWDLALAAYNAGSEAVRRYGGIPPYSETRQYVRSILGLM